MVFSGVTYLGSASIVAPKTEEEIYKNMEVMNRESKCAITVNLIVPDNSEGFVRLAPMPGYESHTLVNSTIPPPASVKPHLFCHLCSTQILSTLSISPI